MVFLLICQALTDFVAYLFMKFFKKSANGVWFHISLRCKHMVFTEEKLQAMNTSTLVKVKLNLRIFYDKII